MRQDGQPCGHNRLMQAQSPSAQVSCVYLEHNRGVVDRPKGVNTARFNRVVLKAAHPA